MSKIQKFFRFWAKRENQWSYSYIYFFSSKRPISIITYVSCAHFPVVNIYRLIFKTMHILIFFNRF